MSSEIIEKSSALVNRSFTGVLGTVDESGNPQLKAMIKTAGKWSQGILVLLQYIIKESSTDREKP